MPSTATTGSGAGVAHPVDVRVRPALSDHDRLTTAFRVVLAIPHLILVGGPMAAIISWTWMTESGGPHELGGGGGVLGAVAGVCAIIAWFAIVFGARHPEGFWKLGAFYLRWRVKAVAYTALLLDEYPPPSARGAILWS